MVTYYRDVFLKYGFRWPIQGFSFQIDTDNNPPICCKPPRYVPGETEVMRNLVGGMDENGVVEEENGTWGALVFLAEKPH